MNEYGLDSDYFSKKLKSIIRDIEHYTPCEMANELERLLTVAKKQEEEHKAWLERIKPQKI